jgi:peptidoglycan-N-acetylglucosamine deacetylase
MPMSNETMTTTDHRSPGVAQGLAVACSIVSGAYLLPAVAGLPALVPALRPLLRPFGIADRTLDGRGYGLTFDDGPHAQGTPAVLEILAAQGVQATFFLVGEQVARNPSLAAEIVAAGHGIGLHCDRHRNLLRLGPRAVREDIARARALIEETTGQSIERYRPPYGIFHAAALTIAKQNDWRPLLWTRWGRDWAASATPESITERLVGGGVAEGSVLLLHDADDYSAAGSWRQTAAALPRVLDALAAGGLKSTLAI